MYILNEIKTFEISNRVLKLDSRIDTEISNVKAILEAFKADTVRYIAGNIFLGKNLKNSKLQTSNAKNSSNSTLYFILFFVIGSLFTALVTILGALRYFTL